MRTNQNGNVSNAMKDQFDELDKGMDQSVTRWPTQREPWTGIENQPSSRGGTSHRRLQSGAWLAPCRL